MAEPLPSPPKLGLSTGRLETLVDGVLAILLTLLVLDVRAPTSIAEPAALWDALGQLWPKYFSFVISFGVLAIFWFGHRMEYHYIERADRLLIWITMLWLLTLTALPFSAALLGNNASNPVALIVYGVNMLVAGLVRWLHWHYATAGHRLVAVTMPQPIIRKVWRRFLLIPALYVVPLILAYAAPRLALWLLGLLPLLYVPAPKEDANLTSLKRPEENS